MKTPRCTLSVRETTYRNTPGWLISGLDQWGRHISIFCRTKDGAVMIRDAKKSQSGWEDDSPCRVTSHVFSAESVFCE
jgi:hypothetical protein